jgi:AcrR family transcriptional regulator
VNDRQAARGGTRSGARASSSRRPGAQQRLLDAVTEVAVRDGYAHLTVERILAAAGVSRATFYQYFCDVEDCFWSAYREHADRLVRDVTAAVSGSRERELEVLDALVAAAISRPQVARLLMREGLAAGATGLSERDALIARIECAMSGSAAGPSTLDLPAAILIGGTFGFLSMSLSDGGAVDCLREQVLEWAGAFARRSSQPSWSARLTPAFSRPAARALAPPGGVRPGGAPRERILRATAATICAKGYREIAVADIVAAAGVSRRGFYNEFSSKDDAFVAAFEHGFQQAIAACTPGFFISAPWPERVWHGAQAFTGFFSRDPLLAYLCCVECYALGPEFARRVHDMQLAFTLFLEDGYRQRPQAQSLSRACSALTATTIFELAFQASARNPSLYLRRLHPLAVYVALVPFIGLEEAGAFVMGNLPARRPGAPAA